MPVQTRSAYRATRSSIQIHTSNATKLLVDPSTSRSNNDGSKGKNTSKPSQNSQSVPICKRSRYRSDDIGTIVPGEASEDAATVNGGLLSKIPVDIFVEIAQHLQPLDLLYLSRTNKLLRKLLLSRWNAPIWRSARRSVQGLPPCPMSICEPQYAALLFTKSCSTCGKETPREVDAVHLVRLCAKCYEKQSIDASLVTDYSLVFVSYDPVPGKNRGTNWCLTNDVRVVDSKIDELDMSEDEGAKMRWIQERRDDVNRRYWSARSLRKWLGIDNHRSRKEKLQYKSARLLEVKSRLADQGWVEGDFTSSESRKDNQLHFLMCNTEPLVWEDLYPKLLEYLNSNRHARLQREMNARKYGRELVLRECMYALREQLGPFARVTTGSTSPSSTLMDAGWDFEHSKLLLANPFPSTYQAYSWPELKTLLETDISVADFMVKLADQSMLKNLVINWKSALEASLLSLLPEDTSRQVDNVPDLIMNPLGNFSPSSQKLLRADAIFSGQDRLRFYPDDFVNTSLGTGNVTYHIQGAKIAKALLSTLNRPDASYLELKAMGRAFHCGRCHSPPRYMTWQEMVQHYITETTTWYKHSVAREVCQAERFALTFTHNADVVQLDRPLVSVRVVCNTNVFPGHHGSTRRCKVCQSVLIRQWYHVDYIIGHVRDVHLIKQPELGIHYY